MNTLIHTIIDAFRSATISILTIPMRMSLVGHVCRPVLKKKDLLVIELFGNALKDAQI